MEHALSTRNACVFFAEGRCLTNRCLANGKIRHNNIDGEKFHDNDLRMDFLYNCKLLMPEMV
jgi:hypothetical protein